MEAIKEVNIGELQSSPFNPRRLLPNIEELSGSIKTKGIVEPILVRPIDGHMEIVDGHRRVAAAAGVLGRIPCLVRQMTDDEAREVQLVKALQREGLHPYDEAVSMVKLLGASGGDYEAVAAKVGKTENYVRRRIKLVELIPSVSKLFMDGKLGQETAFIIARLNIKDQAACVAQLKKMNNYGVSEASWFVKNLYRELKRAPWKPDDADLYPAAGACAMCPKQTGAQPGLFADVESGTTCIDRECFEEKMKRFIARAKKDEPGTIDIASDFTARREGILGPMEYRELLKSAERCEDTKSAVVVVGDNRGARLQVCVNKRCGVHRGGGLVDTSEEKAAKKKAAKKQKVAALTGALLFDRIGSNCSVLDEVELRFIAERFWQQIWHDGKRDYCKKYEIEPTKSSYGGKDYAAPVLKRIGEMNKQGLQQFLLAMAALPLLSRKFVSEEIKSIAKKFPEIRVGEMSYAAEAQIVSKKKPVRKKSNTAHKAAKSAKKRIEHEGDDND